MCLGRTSEAQRQYGRLPCEDQVGRTKQEILLTSHFNASIFDVDCSDIPVGSCGSDSYFGLGMMNGSLEECERWQQTDPVAMREYEEYKCKHLRGSFQLCCSNRV